MDSHLEIDTKITNAYRFDQIISILGTFCRDSYTHMKWRTCVITLYSTVCNGKMLETT